MTGGWKWGSPDASTCCEVHGDRRLDVLVDEVAQPRAQLLRFGARARSPWRTLTSLPTWIPACSRSGSRGCSAGTCASACTARAVRPRAGSGTADAVAVVIPARDEEHNLPTVLGGPRVADDAAPREVIVVDDGSHDTTAAVAAARGAERAHRRAAPGRVDREAVGAAPGRRAAAEATWSSASMPMSTRRRI